MCSVLPVLNGRRRTNSTSPMEYSADQFSRSKSTDRGGFGSNNVLVFSFEAKKHPRLILRSNILD
eukprot:1674665-Prymnesium_polylepis.1